MTLTTPECFTITYEHGTNAVDTVDSGGDPDLIPLMGKVLVIPQTRDQRPLLTPAGGLTVRTFDGYLDVDGVLKDKQGGTPGMRVWLNDPEWGIDEFWYEVRFDVTTGQGEVVTLTGGYFEAPGTDIVIPLQQVLASTGSSIVATGRQLGLYVGDIIGAGTAGRAVLASADQTALWGVLGTVPSGNLPSYVDDVLEFATLAAFPSVGATGKIYVALDTGAQYRWSGSIYVRIGDSFDPNDVGFDIVLIAGQSNAMGAVAGTSAIDLTYLDPTDSRILQWPGSGSFAALGRPIQAVDPLFHHAQFAGCVGPGMTFAREIVRRLKPNRKILLVPCAHGGTGFTTSSLGSPPAGYSTAAGGGWDPSGGQGGINLYAYAIAQANAALAYSPNNRVLCAIWVQGEADTALTQSAYAAKLDALIDGFRAGITGATDMPFLIGQMVPEFIAYYGGLNPNTAQIDTPRRKVKTAFSYGVTGHNDGLTPPIHYDNEGQRLNGARIAAVLDFANANVLGTNPVTPGTVSLTQAGTTVLATWARTAGRVTDYNVRYRVNGGSWTALTRAQSVDPSASIPSMTLGAVVDVQAQTVNEAGVSGWTASGSITLAQLPNAPTVVLGTPVGTSIPYTITAPTVDGTHSAATYFVVEFKTSAGSTWTTAGTVTALTGSISAPSYSTAYDVRVSAGNAAGTGPPSSTQSATTGASTPLLDAVGVTAYRAHGLRKLRSAYSGAAVRVRFTDATEQDIGFASGTNDLDTIALLAGASAHGGSAWIKTWYDQSGNGRNVTQSTTAQQARIVNANVLDVKNTKPAAVFSSSNYVDSTNVGLYAAGAASELAVYSSTKGGSAGLVAERGATGSPKYNTGYQDATSGALTTLIADDAAAIFAANTGPVLADATLAQVSFVDTGTAVQNWVDGATVAATTYSRSGKTLTLTTHSFGSSAAAGVYISGQVCELVEFTSALSTAQRQAGAANQKSYYGTA